MTDFPTLLYTSSSEIPTLSYTSYPPPGWVLNKFYTGRLHPHLKGTFQVELPCIGIRGSTPPPVYP